MEPNLRGGDPNRFSVPVSGCVRHQPVGSAPDRDRLGEDLLEALATFLGVRSSAPDLAVVSHGLYLLGQEGRTVTAPRSRTVFPRFRGISSTSRVR